MNFDWQAVVAQAIVFGALAYLAQIFYRKWIRPAKAGESSGCGSCGSCPSARSPNANDPIVIEVSTPGGGFPITTLPPAVKK